MKRIFLFVFFMVFLAAKPSFATGMTQLDKGLHRLLAKIQDKKELAIPSIMISPNNFFDSESDKSAPLAVEIYKRLEEIATAVNVEIQKPQAGPLDGWIIKGHWFLFGDQVSISLQAIPWQSGERGKIIVVPVSVPFEEAQSLLNVNDMDAWGRTLLHRLQKQLSQTRAKSLYIRPLQIDGEAINIELIDMFSGWLHRHFLNSNTMIPLSVSEELSSVYERVLRKRAKENKKLCLTAAILDAGNQLSGKAVIKDDNIHLSVQLENEKAEVLNKASVKIPVKALPNGVRLKVALGKDSMLEAKDSLGFSKNDLKVEITSQRGELSSVFFGGEKIRFFARTNKPAWVYIINVNSSGEAFILYSTKTEKEKMDGKRMLIVPDDVLPYELTVEPPYGRDIIWAVASEEKLDLPEQLEGDMAKADVIKKHIRSMAEKSDKGYSEARLLITTVKN